MVEVMMPEWTKKWQALESIYSKEQFMCGGGRVMFASDAFQCS
jgi:hypothetical protein